MKPDTHGPEPEQGSSPPVVQAPATHAQPDSEERYFPRLSITIRAQHIVLLASCVLLIASGLPLRYPDSSISQFLFGVTGGVRLAGLIHRVGAVGLIVVGCFHMAYISFTREGRREFVQLVPRFGDFRHLAQNVAHFFDLRRTRARFSRWSYIQKFDYWAVYWGMVVMIGTGLVLWFENPAMALLPKFMLDVAREAHSDEGLLATLAIIVWHMYNVHLNPVSFPMNRTWLTGTVSEHELRVEHSLEYERMIAEGVTPVPAAVRKPRIKPLEARPFPGAWPFAAVLIAIAVAGLGLWLALRPIRRPEQGQQALPISEALRQRAERREAAASETPSQRMHPLDFVRTHPPKTRAAAQRCHQCHEPSFCNSCHETARPANHAEPDWPHHHSWAVAQPGRNCQTCHANGFCLACHKSHRPTTHLKSWQGLHGKASLLKGANCALCHTDSGCSRCHGGLVMPHPGTFINQHQALARRDDRICMKCHKSSDCLVCHRGTEPPSHAGAWMERHGKWAMAKKQDCSICHGSTLCSECHRGVEMPHPRGWNATKHQVAARADESSCGVCHKRDECAKCHAVAFPHPSDWVSKHGAAAKEAPAACARCHEPGRKPHCLTCHRTAPPPSHTGEFKKGHASSARKSALCALCHESSRSRDACLTCHKVPMPHPAGFAAAHAKVASFAPGSSCLRCHTREKTCNACHPQ